MAVSYSQTQILSAYLAGRKRLLEYEQEKIDDAKIGKPCTCDDKEQRKIIFLLFCVENLDHITVDADKDNVISKLITAGKQSKYLISSAEIAAFELTDKGILLISKI